MGNKLLTKEEFSAALRADQEAYRRGLFMIGGIGWCAPRSCAYIFLTGKPERVGDEAIIWAAGMPDKGQRVMLSEGLDGKKWLVSVN